MLERSFDEVPDVQIGSTKDFIFRQVLVWAAECGELGRHCLDERKPKYSGP